MRHASRCESHPSCPPLLRTLPTAAPYQYVSINFVYKIDKFILDSCIASMHPTMSHPGMRSWGSRAILYEEPGDGDNGNESPSDRQYTPQVWR